MNKFIFLAFFFLSLVPKGFSQTNLNDYSYVVVPVQFEFLNQKDKYQLNSIAEFLFNKHGFNAFKSDAVPDVKRCDGLYADLIKVTAMLRTKFVIVLKDCNGFEVFRTAQGVSKLKEFKRAHQDALRKAFLSFEGLGVNQRDITTYSEETKVEAPIEEIVKTEVPKEVVPVAVSIDGPVEAESVPQSNLPEGKFSSYSYNGLSYMLRKTDEGYFLYEESTSSEEGLILKGRVEAMDATRVYFTDQDNKIFKASFDASENLTIQKGDTTEVYKRLR